MTKKPIGRPRKTVAPIVDNNVAEDIAIEQHIEDESKKTKFDIRTVISIIACVITIVLLVIIFARDKKRDDVIAPVKDNTQKIDSLQARAQMFEDSAMIFAKQRDMYKEIAFEYLQKPEKNEIHYIENKKKYDAVPDLVRRFNREQLRSAITDVVNKSDSQP